MASNNRRGRIPFRTTGIGEHVDEVYSLGGFFGEWAHIYRHNNLAHPIRWSDDRMVYSGLDANALTASDATDPRGTPLKLLEGDGIAISVSQRAHAMPFAEKNVDFHQIRFYDRGRFRLETELGPLEVGPGDFVVIPKGLMYRETPLPPEGDGNGAGGDAAAAKIFVFEVDATVKLAEEMWDSVGYASLFIDYSEMELPEPVEEPAADVEVETEVRVKYDGELHSVWYEFDPLRDVIGWVGDPVLFKMNAWSVPAPGSSRGHLTPPATCVLFGEERAWLLNCMTMQPFPTQPAPDGSIGAPSHQNDYDEVWFAHRSRLVPEGHLWLLPRTLPHPGFKIPPVYPPNPVRPPREMRINFDTKVPLTWSPEVREALFDDPIAAQYSSFFGVPIEAAPERVRRRVQSKQTAP